MSEIETHDGEIDAEDEALAYETPVVEDLPTIDGPAVTAAGTTRPI